MSREGERGRWPKLVEDFVAKLAKVLSSYERQEYSIEDMEMQTKGIVSFLGALSQRWSLLIIFLLYMHGMNFDELRELLPGISSRKQDTSEAIQFFILEAE